MLVVAAGRWRIASVRQAWGPSPSWPPQGCLTDKFECQAVQPPLHQVDAGFFKDAGNLKHSAMLLVGFFNFCRVRLAHNETPAQVAGIKDHWWTIEELLAIEA